MYNYMTFEEDAARKRIRGRVLKTLEFDKIILDLQKKAKTAFGLELCKDLCPTTDFNEVSATLNDTNEAFVYINKYGYLPLSGFNDIRNALSYGKAGGTMSMRQLLDVASFLRSVEQLKKVISNEHADMMETNLFSSISALVPENRLEVEISSSINNEDEMNDRASDVLYQLRREKKDIAQNIRTLLDRVIRNNEEILQEAIITLREDRYCVPVRTEYKNRIPGIVHDTSSTGQTVFIEPMSVVEANNRIREISSLEKIEIDRILDMLTAHVMHCEDSLKADISLVTQIDFACAKADLAIDMNSSYPSLNEEGKISLRGARHPLIPKDTVVPVNIELGYDYQTLVITGPNTGGKTVSLKTCGLLTLMTMAGLMIPAETGSEIAVFDRVLADIGDEQSIEQSLSTFSAHMSNVVFIFKNIRGRSLILLDELGAGTDPVEGAALAVAILDKLKNKGCTTMATTHYKELKAYAVGTEGVMNAACEFDAETLAPTYKLIIGRPGSSNAFIISKKLGVPAAVIDDALARLSQDELSFERLLEEAEKSNREAETLRMENEKLNQELTKKIQELEDERAALKASKTRILNDSRANQKKLLEKKEKELEELSKNLIKQISSDNKEESLRELDKIRRRLRAGVEDLTDDSEDRLVLDTVSLPGEPPKEIKAGEMYFIPHLNITGKAVSAPGKSGNVQIQSGAIKVTVKKDQLRVVTAKQAQEKAKAMSNSSATNKYSKYTEPETNNYSKMKFNKSMSTSSELMLLGLKSGEAESKLAAYIDDCCLGGIKEVRIVHGKGTGALRMVVQEYLSADPRVESYRAGIYGEGDDGVTIATLY